jgi:serine phosphatase RsbU (regulator of sigma subunit)
MGITMGIGLLAVIGVLYVLIAKHTGSPLVMLAVPALLTAAASGPTETAVVGAAGLLATIALGLADPNLDRAGFWVRLAIVAVAEGFGLATAWTRRREEAKLREAQDANRVLDAMQGRLVANPIPPASVRVQVRYLPGDDRLAIGGDFLDAVTLPDGALGFVLGDVSGHGPRAAAFGVVLRAGWKSIAITDPVDPARWLDAMQEVFFEDARYDGFATALVGRHVPGEPHVTLSSAGHCWPVHLGDRPTLIDTNNSAPLGIPLVSGPRRTTRVPLGPHDRLLCYTDGLIENRRGPATRERWSESDLLAWLSSHADRDLDALIQSFGAHGFDDDVAVLVIEPMPEAVGAREPAGSR